MRKHGKVDRNHSEIVRALRKAGCSVLSLASLGNGAPDLLVASRSGNHLLEVKDSAKPPSQRRLTPDEARWISNWRSPVYVVNTVDEALKAVGVMT